MVVRRALALTNTPDEAAADPQRPLGRNHTKEEVMSELNASPKRRARATKAVLALLAVTALGAASAGPAQAEPRGPCDGACPRATVLYNTRAFSTPYLNARTQVPQKAGIVTVECETRGAPAGRRNHPWWSRMSGGRWIHNGDLQGGQLGKRGIRYCPAPANDAPPVTPPSGFPPDVTSAPDVARYDDALSWSGGANCSGGFMPGAKRMQDWLRANWGSATIGGYNCRPNSASPSKTSIHGVGRASDWSRDAGNATHRAQVASFIARMSANGAAMARATGVQYWIWDRQQYSVRGTSVQRSDYSGPNPHTDHVHIEQNIAGSKLQTSYWRLAGG